MTARNSGRSFSISCSCRLIVCVLMTMRRMPSASASSCSLSSCASCHFCPWAAARVCRRSPGWPAPDRRSSYRRRCPPRRADACVGNRLGDRIGHRQLFGPLFVMLKPRGDAACGAQDVGGRERLRWHLELVGIPFQRNRNRKRCAGAMAHADHADLVHEAIRARELMASLQLILVDIVLTTVDIDGNKLAGVLSLELRTNFDLVDGSPRSAKSCLL